MTMAYAVLAWHQVVKTDLTTLVRPKLTWVDLYDPAHSLVPCHRAKAHSLNFVLIANTVKSMMMIIIQASMTFQVQGRTGCNKPSSSHSSYITFALQTWTQTQDLASAKNYCISISHQKQFTQDIRKLTMKTFRSMLGTDWIAPSLSWVLLCHCLLVQVLLSHMDQPVH